MTAFPSDEDRDAQIARRIEDQARDAVEGAAAAATDAREALDEMIAEAKNLRKQIASSAVSPDDARRALAELRQRHKEIAAHLPAIKIAYDRAAKTVEDPAARVTELTSKFGSLQQ
jgi:hypothetical protein